MRTARGLCAPVNCLLVSSLHLFCLCWKEEEEEEKKSWSFLRSMFPQSRGGYSVHLCSCGSFQTAQWEWKNDGSDGVVRVHGFESAIC